MLPESPQKLGSFSGAMDYAAWEAPMAESTEIGAGSQVDLCNRKLGCIIVVTFVTG